MSLCSRYLVLIAFLLSSPAIRAQTPTVLAAGWNLIGNGSTANLNVADATLFGDPGKVVTVWKWVPAGGKWAFYAPSMTSQGLSDYVAGKGYDVLATINADGTLMSGSSIVYGTLYEWTLKAAREP